MGQNQGFLKTYSLLFWQIGATLLCGVLYFATKGNPVSLAPALLAPVYLAAREILKREKPDQDILLGLLILSFFLDDISQVAWGRNVDTITEALGAILFKSFGITGNEAFILIFAAWIIFIQGPKCFREWYQLRFFTVLAVGFGVFLMSLLAGLIGVTSGGVIKTMFIQIRFLHALPLWVMIGFVVWRDREFSRKALKWITIMMSLKSMQAVFVYLTHRGIYSQEEYLVDHYYSGFAVMAFVGLAYYLFTEKSFKIKVLVLLSAAVMGMAYVWNDRRTSYVGAAFALGVLPALLPLRLLKRYATRGLLGIGLILIFTAVTWNMELPLGFIGHTYRSFGTETGLEEPSYRDLENANLFHAVTQAPNIGIGYGKEFDEIFPLPDISTVYERYRMIPHNSFLASWAYGGPQTLAALSLLFATMIASAGNLLRKTRDTTDALLAVMALFFFLQYLTYTFGDLGFQIMRNQMMAGLFLGACFRFQAELDRENKEGSWQPH